MKNEKDAIFSISLPIDVVTKKKKDKCCKKYKKKGKACKSCPKIL